ncbi:GMC family oxidoreductase [Actinokineospora terrae]|uniref:Choline dehydrogenase n=1 Tax=Actinokineospora terrae TaxID=155974 RepID=A0A1H9LME2_9PSEU|nr:GMC family oxidoreductase N-terminal domain-containing protein [Actinokineospora terrae]SER12305.1 choline dehydrogenase [Actinokineospora terrae]
MSAEWEHVIVGAGSAGAVVAARLAARGHRVLLVEAGVDQPVDREVVNPLRDGTRLILEGFNWDYQANLRGRAREHATVGAGVARSRALWGRFPYRLGKVVGGSSAVNGAVAMRALPGDFADWVAMGNPEWSWDRVLPFYKMVERDTDFPGGDHGVRGPIPIRRPRRDQLHELDLAFWDECRRMGVPDLPDLNAGVDVGVGAVPANTVGTERVDTASGYLAPVRDLPNLEIRTGCRVTRLLLDGRRVTGVELLQDNRTVRVTARNVVLSAGAVGSPAVLLRSGIGPADTCADLGVTPVVDLPGVGENLVDHPSVVIWAKPRDGLCRPGIPWRQVAARVSSDGQAADLQVWLLNNVETATIPGFVNRLGWPMVVGISVMLLRPASRGRVLLPDADPGASPVIELGFGSVDDDVDRLAHGVRTAWRILRSERFAARLTEVQLWNDAMVADDTVLRSAVRNVMSPGWHAIGSARMGPASDPMSVVDQRCRVHGIGNLRVVDASVFPTMPSAPTNLTTIMLAEKIAGGLGE